MLIRGRPFGAAVSAEFMAMHYSAANFNGYTNAPYHDLGQKWLRMWDTRTDWFRVETTKGVFNWTRMDAYAAIVRAAGCKALYTLCGPAAWGCGVDPVNGRQPVPPTNTQDIVDFVLALLARHGDVIRAVEIWNEANVTKYYAGDLPKLREMTIAVSQAVRAAYPGILIVGANASIPSAPRAKQAPWLAEYLNGVLPHIDAVGIHTYVYPEPPECMEDMLNAVRQVLAALGAPGKPVWNTEVTVNEYRSGGTIVVGTAMPDTLGVAYLARLLLASAAGGAERAFFYGLDYDFSQIRLLDIANPATRLPPANCYAFLAGLLPGMRFGTLEQAFPLYRRSFAHRDGRLGAVLWCADDRTATADLTGYASAVDALGQTVALSAATPITMSPIFAFSSAPFA